MGNIFEKSVCTRCLTGQFTSIVSRLHQQPFSGSPSSRASFSSMLLFCHFQTCSREWSAMLGWQTQSSNGLFLLPDSGGRATGDGGRGTGDERESLTTEPISSFGPHVSLIGFHSPARSVQIQRLQQKRAIIHIVRKDGYITSLPSHHSSIPIALPCTS